MTGWARDLALGARLALAGGRRATGRLLLTAISTGLGVAVLLLAAAIPGMWHTYQDRTYGLAYESSGSLVGWPDQHPELPVPPGVDPLYMARGGTVYRGVYIDGAYLRAAGPRAPLPPGLDRIPAPDEVYVSPALARLLDSPEGALLRPRFPQRIAGLLGEAGLRGPHDYRFYAGTPALRSFAGSMTVVTAFGGEVFPSSPLPPVLWLLLVVGVVVLLVPVLTVIAAAGRVGGLARDRRLAALRLIGAGSRQTRRIAAGEALVGSVAGVALGVALFLTGRAIAPSIELLGVSFFSSDIHPPWPATILVLLLGPVLAVQAAQFALRGAVIEPLGVLRQAAATRRRLWWRLVPAGCGALLLASALADSGDSVNPTKVIAAIGLLLIGVPVLLPWLVERLVGALPHGSVPYELAVRRLRLDSGAPARLVGGVAVIVAGAIALQAIALSAERELDTETFGPDAYAPTWSTVILDGSRWPAAAGLTRELAAIPDVTSLGTVRRASVTAEGAFTYDRLNIADCATIGRVYPGTRCTDGDVFLDRSMFETSPAGMTLSLVDAATGRPVRWRLPAALKPMPAANRHSEEVLVTPGALHGVRPFIAALELRLVVGSSDLDTVERVRNTVGRFGWQAEVPSDYGGGPLEVSDALRQFRTIRTGLLIGTLITLLLAGASMVSLALEQIAERRRPIAMLAASGVPRSVLGRSVLWQNLLPMAAAVPVALLTGTALGQALLRLIPSRLPPVGVDWAQIGALTLASGLLVLLTTALTLPAVRRASRPTELRTE